MFPHDVGTANLSLRPGFVSVRPVRLRLVLNARALLNLVADIVRRRHVGDKNLVAVGSGGGDDDIPHIQNALYNPLGHLNSPNTVISLFKK